MGPPIEEYLTAAEWGWEELCKSDVMLATTRSLPDPLDVTMKTLNVLPTTFKARQILSGG